MKKFVAIIMSLLMALSVSVPVAADDEQSSGDNNVTMTIIGTFHSEKVDLSEYLDGYVKVEDADLQTMPVQIDLGDITMIPDSVYRKLGQGNEYIENGKAVTRSRELYALMCKSYDNGNYIGDALLTYVFNVSDGSSVKYVDTWLQYNFGENYKVTNADIVTNYPEYCTVDTTLTLYKLVKGEFEVCGNSKASIKVDIYGEAVYY